MKKPFISARSQAQFLAQRFSHGATKANSRRMFRATSTLYWAIVSARFTSSNEYPSPISLAILASVFSGSRLSAGIFLGRGLGGRAGTCQQSIDPACMKKAVRNHLSAKAVLRRRRGYFCSSQKRVSFIKSPTFRVLKVFNLSWSTTFSTDEVKGQGLSIKTKAKLGSARTTKVLNLQITLLNVK